MGFAGFEFGVPKGPKPNPHRWLLQLRHFDSSLALFQLAPSRPSKDLKDLSNLIAQTNKRLQLQFKREHKYELELHEEQLYKEVLIKFYNGLCGSGCVPSTSFIIKGSEFP